MPPTIRVVWLWRAMPGLLLIALLQVLPLASGRALVQEPTPIAPAEQAVPVQEPSVPPEDPRTPVFRARSELVVLHVNVLDRRSDAVPDLPREAFTVFEEDRPQPIAFFEGAEVPVAVGLIIDNSGSMIARRAMVVAGATTFAASSHPEDELFTVVFNEHVRFGLPPAIAFTQSQPLLTSSFARFPPGGRTALYDAVIAGLGHLERSQHQKRALVVLSDGDDNASSHTRDEMLAKVSSSDALIYTIVNRIDVGGPADAATMKRLAELSGGLAYTSNTERAVVANFEEIAGNLRRGYSIGYAPPMVDSTAYRRVRVTVRAPGRNNLSVRVRHGYLPKGGNRAP